MNFDLFASGIAGIALVIYLVLFIRQRIRKNRTATIRYSGIEALANSSSGWRVRFYWIPVLLRISAIILLLIAFTRPQKGLETVRTAREGIAIQMVLDRSSSMLQPLSFRGKESDRLEVVKSVMEEFILGNDKELEGRHNDMIGLISFAGFVEENSPLTFDHRTLVSFARTIRPAGKIEDGTMIGDAIYYTSLRLISADEFLGNSEKSPEDYTIKSKIIILLTDGQQTRGGMHPVEAAEFAAENDIKIYTIAITGDQNYSRKDSVFGSFFSMTSPRLDTSILEEVARKTGGLFGKATSGDALLELYRQIDRLEKSQFEESYTTYKEIFPTFVGIALILLLIEIVLSHTVFRKIP